MPSINILDSATVSKIAAGEVVERPLSVVKELVENSIDAGSTEISINIEEGGHRLIRISDNGSGMSREDASICLKRHTTSKLSKIEDLEKVISLGFRGEALHSIGSVARLSVVTSDGFSDNGWKVRMEGGEEFPVEPAARVRGTTVEVENLFFNVPARRKFLKSPKSEITVINSLVTGFIIGRPDIGFELFNNGKQVLKTKPGEDHLSRIGYIMGGNIARELAHLTGAGRNIGLNAWFSLPDMTFPNRKYQLFFVNGRLVRDKNLTVAVDAAYRGMTPAGRYGLAILFLDVPASSVDANVHPTKTEVRFENTHEIHSLIYRTLRGRFAQSEPGADGPLLSLVSQVKTSDKFQDSVDDSAGALKARPFQREVDFQMAPVVSAPFGEGKRERREEDIEDSPDFMPDNAFMPAPDKKVSRNEADGVDENPAVPAVSGGPAELKILGQFYNTFIMAQMDGAPVFIDQHVASERIIYNQLKRKSIVRGAQLQLISQPVEVPVDVHSVLSENLEKVRQIGLEIEPFGERAFVIRSVTHNAAPFDPASLLISVAEEIKSAPKRAPDDLLLDRLLTVASCKMAVKAGQELTHEEMKHITEQLMKEEYNRTCPHGRPIFYSISQDLLNSWFKR